MPTVYVAKSQRLQKWGAEVGLTKHVYKVGTAEGKAEPAIQALNEAALGGESDWRLVKQCAVEEGDAEAMIARIAAKETEVDPGYYPKIKGARGLFKVKESHVAGELIVKRLMGGAEEPAAKPKTADFADYLIRAAVE